MENGKNVIAKNYADTSVKLEEDTHKLYIETLNSEGLKPDDVEYVVATGGCRYRISFRNANATDITAGALGAKLLYPETRTVIDMGYTNTRAIKIDEKGKVLKFAVNDRCAAGAGAFLERIAAYTEVNISDIGKMALLAQQAATISSICSVLAETEIINLVTLNTPLENILAGAVKSIIDRIMPQIRIVGVEPQVTLTGGCVFNPAVQSFLSSELGAPVNASEDLFYANAIGASFLGYKRLHKLKVDKT
jgi:predicted CoA-substrate-specific enzyme activase